MELDGLDNVCTTGRDWKTRSLKGCHSNSGRSGRRPFLMESLEEVLGLGLLGQCEELGALSGIRLEVAQHCGSNCFLACNCDAS